MKKRVFSFIITLSLLLTLIPFGAIRAEAASEFVASPEVVEMIKNWEGFCFKPYWDYGQWTVGFGTRAPDEHLARYQAEGISHEEATELLNTFLVSMGKSVNSFIDKFGLTVNQAQFDAMLSMTFNCGSRWMLVPNTLRTAVVEGMTGDDLMFNFAEWSSAGGVTLPGLVRRRMAEANLYLNGTYDCTPPANYNYVCFDANGGESDIVVQGFISGGDPVNIRPTVSYEGCTFEGWYTDSTGGEKVEKLDASLNGYTLYAHWRAGEGAGNPQDTPAQTITGTPVNYTKQIASLTLNAFDQPVKGALVIDAFLEGELVDIVAEYTDSTGVKWGKVNGVGWINLTYTQEPQEDTDVEGVTVKVTGTDVNIRRGPGTAYTAVGTARLGEELVITQTSVGGGYTWGKFNRGWIALKYTNYDQVVNEKIENEKENAGSNENTGNTDNNNTTTTPTTPSTPSTPSTTGTMGTVKADYLFVRSGPGVANSVVGGLTAGARVEILEQKAVGGTIWGRTKTGWISLSYVTLDKKDEQAPEQKPEEKPEETTPAPETPKTTGKVKLTSGSLNVRSGPSTGYTVVGSYANGAAVTILEQKTVGTVNWGRTDKGWICMTYVKLDETKVEEPKPEVKPEEPKPEEPKPEEKPAETPSQTTSEAGTVSLTSGCLRIRSGAGTNNAIVGNLYNGAKVTITERKTVGGTQWGKMDKGWICLDYVKFSTNSSSENNNSNTGNTGSVENNTEKPVNGKVNVSDYLCIRNGAGTNYTVVGYYTKGNEVTITEQKNVGGTKWGRTNKGWICLDYVVLDGQTATAPDSTGTAGVVTGTGLRIRNGAGTQNAIVGSLTIGDKVTILETTTVGGVKWGRIEKGWICLDYVKIG